MPLLTEVSVEPISGRPRQAGEISTYSSLFRADTQMDTVLDLALESRSKIEKGKPLVVLSVGSSFGAEADSVLGYISRAHMDIGKISLIGVDINSQTVDQAHKARYIASTPRVRTAEGLTDLDLASHLSMFEVTPHPDDSGKFIIDTSDLRAQHAVTFMQGDLVKDDLDLPLADIVLCNNLLFHLKAEDAEKLVDAMARHLAPDGVMSFGANPKQVRMSGNYDETDYPQWRRSMGEKLSKLGIEPVLYDTARKAPFVFKKVGPPRL
jgi:chemotaxis methyl-accepting protein methylase